MYTYKFLGNKDETYYYTRTFNGDTNSLLEHALRTRIYQYHVDMGFIKTLNGKVVVFEFSTLTPLLNLTIVHHNNSTYRVDPVSGFEEYDKILDNYFKLNTSRGKLSIVMNPDDIVIGEKLFSGVIDSKDKVSLKTEKTLSKRVMFDNLVVYCVDAKLPCDAVVSN
jgi:hypothetical protein